MEWNIKKFDELSKHELYEILKARTDIFVVEQNCAYPELDDYDQASLHVYLQVDGEIAAYARLLPKGLKYDNAVAIGRVLVVRKFRNQGFAQNMMDRAIHFLKEEWKEDRIKIQAQHYLKEFYSSFGFQQISDVYLEDGIPHIDMLWTRN